MSELILVQFLEDKNQHEFHGQLPLHCTLLHWFETNASNQDVADSIVSATQQLGSFTTTAILRDLFGPNNDIPVTRLERTPKLHKLHLTLMDVVLSELDGKVDTRWSGTVWNPHVSDANSSQLTVGEEISIDTISIIERINRNSPKLLIGSVDLS